MNNRPLSILALTVFISSAFASIAVAQTSNPVLPGHPRVNQVDQRLETQENKINAGVASGAINAKQEARDIKREEKVSGELTADEARNGGNITKAEQFQMNRQLNNDGSKINKQLTKPVVSPSAGTLAPVSAQ